MYTCVLRARSFVTMALFGFLVKFLSLALNNTVVPKVEGIHLHPKWGADC